MTPGVMNVVPGSAELSIDIRSIERARTKQVTASVHRGITEIAARRKLAAHLELLNQQDPVTLDPRIVQALEDGCRNEGLRFRRMPSGAGHDAMQMAFICPSGMLLVPSRDGISHNRDEWTDHADIVTGLQALVAVALDLAERGY